MIVPVPELVFAVHVAGRTWELYFTYGFPLSAWWSRWALPALEMRVGADLRLRGWYLGKLTLTETWEAK